MKTPFFSLLLFLFSITLSASEMHVQVKSAALKTNPSFLSPTLLTLRYGDSINSLSQKGDWIEAKAATKKGWIHTSALTTKEIVISASSKSAPSSVSTNEVMMAGKGFNAQVEGQHRKENPKLRFDLVDKMEQSTVSPESQRQFAKSGQLSE